MWGCDLNDAECGHIPVYFTDLVAFAGARMGFAMFVLFDKRFYGCALNVYCDC
jgi:hypothetical protein